MLLLEFSEIIKLPLEDMRQNWLEALPKIQNVQRLSAKNLTADAQTMSVLYHLPKLFSKAKESGKILNCYRNGTPIEETVPDVNEAPQLIAIANGPLSELQTMCYIDGIPIFEAHGCEAIFLLLAVYWCFQVQFPQNAKQQFAFIAIAVLKDVAIRDISADILKKITLTTVLKSCDLLPAMSAKK